MKKLYKTPVVEIVKFKSEDIIVTSGVIITPGPGVDDTETDFE